MPFNGRTLKPEEKSYLLKVIKEGVTKTKCNELLFTKFGRTINDRNLTRFATLNGLHFRSFTSEHAFTGRELGILRGLFLINASSQRRSEDLPNRSAESMSSKLKKLKTAMVLGEDLKNNVKNDILKGKSIKKMEKTHKIPAKYLTEFKQEIEESKVEIEDLKRWEAKDIDAALDQIERSQQVLRSLESDQSVANLNISTNSKYIGLMFLSDIHLENVNTDTQQLRRDIEIVKNTKDFYVGFGGDLIDNFVVGPHKEGVIEAVMPPKAARLVAGRMLERLKGKLLWTILGCHDAWDRDYADYNLPEHIARKQNIPYLGHGGDINLTLKNGKNKPVLYELHVRHKYKGSSAQDGTAVCKNVLRSIDSKFDIVAISHNHFAQIKLEDFLRKQRVFIRTGSYKKEDRFSKKMGFENSEFNARIPVVILNTETKEMMVQSGVRAAATLLNSLNKNK